MFRAKPQVSSMILTPSTTRHLRIDSNHFSEPVEILTPGRGPTGLCQKDLKPVRAIGMGPRGRALGHLRLEVSSGYYWP